MAERIAPGTQVKWTSQSQGLTKTKEGTVICFLPAWSEPKVGLEDGVPIPKSRIKFDFRPTQNDRYIVAVPRGGKSTLFDYYGPRASTLES